MGFGTTDTLLGKQQKNFFLETELTAIKEKEKIGDVSDTNYQYNAGEIVKVTTGGLQRAAAADTVGATTIGVAFENHTPTLDENDGSGIGTFIWAPHVGRTKAYDTAQTYAKGDKLRVADGGLFTNQGAGPHVGYVVAIEGEWLKYRWTMGQNASS